jgi:putative N-acetyltransferase (TIGR04045 family)
MSLAGVISPFSRSAELSPAEDGRRPTCLVAESPEEIAIHFAIREAVFVHEQGFFEGSDRDERDADSATLHMLGLCGRVAGGAVRIYPLDEDGLWKGDRLAVLPAFRTRGLGAPLVRFAVRTAGQREGRLMVAYIQPRNIGFFRRLGWRAVGRPEEYVGRTHQRMEIELSSDP